MSTPETDRKYVYTPTTTTTTTTTHTHTHTHFITVTCAEQWNMLRLNCVCCMSKQCAKQPASGWYQTVHSCTRNHGWRFQLMVEKCAPPNAARVIDQSLVRQLILRGYWPLPVGSGGQRLRWKTPISSWMSMVVRGWGVDQVQPWKKLIYSAAAWKWYESSNFTVSENVNIYIFPKW